MVFLVTDGQSNIGRRLTVPKAQELKKAGVKIFVVAVGRHINGIDEMVRVASYPPKDHLFRVKNLDGFFQIIKLIIQKVSPSKYAIINKGPVYTSLLQSTRPCLYIALKLKELRFGIFALICIANLRSASLLSRFQHHKAVFVVMLGKGNFFFS